MKNRPGYTQIIRLKDNEGVGGTIVLREERGRGTRVDFWGRGEVNVDAIALSLVNAACGICQIPEVRVKLMTVVQIYARHLMPEETENGSSVPDYSDDDLPF